MSSLEQTSRLNIRIPTSLKNRIEEAAMLSGVSLTDFTISNLIESADGVLQRNHHRELSNRDREIFLKMLDAKPKSNKKLKDAFKARKELIAK